MTIYIHNPPEPHAVPTQPVIDVLFQTGSAVDLISGRCGFCPSVPKIWLLEIPDLTLPDSTPNPWFGRHYLRKVPYGSSPAPICQWRSYDPEGLPAANPNAGWLMKWEPNVSGQGVDGFGWSLYSPESDENGTPVDPARWLFSGDQFNGWRCLRPNSFTLQDPGTFPYHPGSLTLSPFHP